MKNLFFLLALMVSLSGCAPALEAPPNPETDAPETLSDIEPEISEVSLSILSIPEEVEAVKVTHFHCEGDETTAITGIELDALRDWVNELELEPVSSEDVDLPSEVAGGECWQVSFPAKELSGFSYCDQGSECFVLLESEWYLVTEPSDFPIAILEESSEPVRMVMVDGQLYYDTGRTNNEMARCGVMDGEISSSVEAGETPTEDGQSNFGSGYGFQWGGTAGEIEVHVDEDWLVFSIEAGDP